MLFATWSSSSVARPGWLTAQKQSRARAARAARAGLRRWLPEGVGPSRPADTVDCSWDLIQEYANIWLSSWECSKPGPGGAFPLDISPVYQKDSKYQFRFCWKWYPFNLSMLLKMPGCQNSAIWWSQLLISFVNWAPMIFPQDELGSWALLSATVSYWAPFSQSSWGDAPHKAAAVRGQISFQAPVQKVQKVQEEVSGELSPQIAILMDGWVNSYCSNNQLDESQTKVLNQDHHSSHGYAVRQN